MSTTFDEISGKNEVGNKKDVRDEEITGNEDNIHVNDDSEDTNEKSDHNESSDKDVLISLAKEVEELDAAAKRLEDLVITEFVGLSILLVAFQ